MMRFQQGFIFAIICLFAVMGCTCLHPNKENAKAVSKNERQGTTQKAGGVRTPRKGDMRVAFFAPIVAVDNQRISRDNTFSEEPDQLVVYYPQNSTHDITLTFIDSEGNEQQLQGTIKIFQYTKNSKLEGEEGEIVKIEPDNNGYTYESIWQNGYGKLTVREDLDDTEQLGAVMLQMELGSKKKKR